MNLLTGMYRELKGNLKRELCHLRVKPLCSISFLTYRCTNCCKTCNIWQKGGDGGDELDRDGWLQAVDNMAGLGVKSLELFGGDALLRKDAIFDVISSCRAHGIETFFPTNANLCDEQTVARLIDSGLDTLYISLDDVEEAQDKVRGVQGNFGKVRDAMDNFFRLRGDKEVQLGVVCTLSRLNFRNFPRLVEFIEQYPVAVIHPRPVAEFSADNIAASVLDGLHPEPFYLSTDGDSHLIRQDELAEFKEMIATMKRRSNKVYVCWSTYYSTRDATFLKGEYPHDNCRLATTLMTVCPNGDVTPCPMYRDYVLGNLTRGDAGSIWGNAKHRRFIEAQQSGRLPVCLNCNISGYHDSSIKKMLRYYGIRAAEKSGLYSWS